MQIHSIILYNDKGDIRILKFNIGATNIITGESKTGKTAIIDIVNYCLGSDECNIREGVIRDTVSWFGLKLQLQLEQVFVARQNPSKIGLSSTSHIYFATADNIEVPNFNELSANSNIDTLKSHLSKKLGIAEYTNKPPEGTSRDPLAVTFKHSRYYCFQPQYLIANPGYLFFNQTDQYVPQSIKDTLPYFLGAVREDTVKIEQLIASKKRDLTRLIKNSKEDEKIKEQGSKRVFELIEEAKQVNLLPANQSIENNNEALNQLRTILSWENDLNDTISSEGENLRNILDEKNGFTKELTRINEDINAASAFEKETTGYTREAGQQKVRLESINLFNKTEPEIHSCPLCDQALNSEIPTITAIRKSLEDLKDNLQTTRAEAPRISKYLTSLQAQKEKIISEIEIRNNNIKALYKEKEEAARFKELNIRKGRVIGRISLIMETYSEIEINNSIKERIDALSEEINQLEEMISNDEKESLLSAALNKINIQMTRWKDLLDLEYKDSPIRFDLKKLTLFADMPKKSIPLNQMGSGANWVAYHLLIHFALYKLFIQDNRPTPRFLIIDQPSQVYFPPDKDISNTGEVKQSSDEAAVKLMFDFILKVTKELHPDLQVIVTDHAKLSSEEFKNAIVEEWRNGNKLIPQEWIA